MADVSNDNGKRDSRTKVGIHFVAPMWGLFLAGIIVVAPWTIRQYQTLGAVESKLVESELEVIRPTTECDLQWSGPGGQGAGPKISWYLYPSGELFKSEKAGARRVCFVKGTLHNQHSEAYLVARSVALTIEGPNGVALFSESHELDREAVSGFLDNRLKPGESYEFQFEMVVPNAYLNEMVSLTSSMSFSFETKEQTKYEQGQEAPEPQESARQGEAG